MRGRIVFLDSSYLDFSEAIETSERGISKLNYRYQHVRGGEAILRYDNYPQHPRMTPPYHHRHTPDGRVTPLPEAPKFIDVIDEVVRTLF